MRINHFETNCLANAHIYFASNLFSARRRQFRLRFLQATQKPDTCILYLYAFSLVRTNNWNGWNYVIYCRQSLVYTPRNRCASSIAVRRWRLMECFRSASFTRNMNIKSLFSAICSRRKRQNTKKREEKKRKQKWVWLAAHIPKYNHSSCVSAFVIII